MLTFSDAFAFFAVDLLVRVTLILAAAYGWVRVWKPQAAVRHAILCAGLCAACVVPLVTAGFYALNLPRWTIMLPSRAASAETKASELFDVGSPIRNNLLRAEPGASSTKTLAVVAHNEPVIFSAEASTENAAASTRRGWRAMLIALSVIWVLGAILKMGGLAASLLQLRRIVAAARPAEPQLSAALMGRVLRRVGLRQPPIVLESPDVFAPVAAGVVRNCVLLPQGCAARLSRTELLSVLYHEGGHLARRDHRVVIMQEIVTSLLWFHPLVHLINSALNQAREEICDNFALGAMDRPDYCAVLLRLAEGLQSPSPLGATSILSRRWPLEERVCGILDELRPTMTKISIGARLTIAAMALAFCSVVAMPQMTNGAEKDDGDATSDDSNARETTDATEKVDLGALSDVRELHEAIRAIRVDLKDADVTITRSEDDQLHVDANVLLDQLARDAQAPGRDFADHVKISTDNETLTVEEVPLPRGLKARRNLAISIALPRPVALNLRTVDGDVAIDYAGDGVDAATTDGDIEITTSVSGSLTVATEDGDILVKSEIVQGNFSATTSDGDISVDASAIEGNATTLTSDGDIALVFQDSAAAPAQSLSARTSDGDIRVELAGAGVTQELTALTAEGSIELVASHRVQADVAMMTQAGEIVVDEAANKPAALQSGSAKMSATSLGEGGVPYRLTADEGDIEVKLAD